MLILALGLPLPSVTARAGRQKAAKNATRSSNLAKQQQEEEANEEDEVEDEESEEGSEMEDDEAPDCKHQCPHCMESHDKDEPKPDEITHSLRHLICHDFNETKMKSLDQLKLSSC